MAVLAAEGARRPMSFDRLARPYSALESLLAGPRLQHCRTAFLPEVRAARSILLVGEGHGRSLEAICANNPGASIRVVDASEGMLAVARARLARVPGAARQIQFQRSSIQEFAADGRFDLIVTHFFLDCFEAADLRPVVEKLSMLLAPRGQWWIADFQIPARGWRKLRARAVLALAYAFFRVAVNLPARRLVPPQPFLRSGGLELTHRRTFNHDLLYTELWQKP